MVHIYNEILYSPLQGWELLITTDMEQFLQDIYLKVSYDTSYI